LARPTREEALSVFRKYNKNESLLKHALAVEAVMRHFAALAGEDQDKWGVIGLIHDLDYEMYPDRHCQMVRGILEEHSFPEDYIHAAESHGYGICSEVAPVHPMEKTLYAIDELTGLVAATALVRPSKSVLDVATDSVKKKWKQKGFAAGVNREVIEKGVADMAMPLDEVINHTIVAMQAVAQEIGLKGLL
jgi:predicted hydrolase (HD superfamily)